MKYINALKAAEKAQHTLRAFFGFIFNLKKVKNRVE